MLSTYLCAVNLHAWPAVALAITICLATAFTGMPLLRRAIVQHSPRLAIVAGSETGFGLWSTHFVAMLGYRPGMTMAYRLVPTVGSLVVAMIAVTTAFVLVERNRAAPRWSRVAVPALFTAGGMVIMHFLGVSAIDIPVRVTFRPDLFGLSLAFALVPLVAAFGWMIDNEAGNRSVWPSSLLVTLATIGVHFAGMAAIILSPARVTTGAGWVVSGAVMAPIVGTAAATVLAICVAVVVVDLRIRHAINAREREFSILAKAVTDCALYMLTPSGHVANWNAGAEQMIGYSEAEAIGLPLDAFYTQADRAAGLPQAALRIAQSTGKFTGEGWRCEKDGTPFWAHVSIERVDDAQGRVIGFAKITRDMSSWKDDQDRVATLQTHLNTALDSMRLGLALFDSNRLLILGNHKLSTLWRLPPGAIVPGLPLDQLLGMILASRRVADFAAVGARLRAAMATRHEDSTSIVFSDDFVVSVASQPLEEGGWVTTFEDISERHRHAARIAHLASHDMLTGLPNRSHFETWCSHKLAQAASGDQRFAVIAIDLKHFKEINDAWGNHEGDRAIQALAQRLRACCTEEAVVARLAGDDFAAAILFDEDSSLTAFVAALDGCFAQPVGHRDRPIPVSARLGLAVYPRDGESADVLLNNAELAVGRAKTSLSETICFYQPEMDETARRRRLMAADLRGVAARHELQLLYQPQHLVATRALVGYEALLRWHHPQRGLVNPMDFIPIAEETGEIFAIGEWVLYEAAREAAAWSNDLTVAVNLSPVQLQQKDLIEKIRRALIDHALPAHRLELEITETAIIADKAHALHVMHQIKDMGISIALDDFGTGYSSLDTLQSFPFDKIKIDKSFLRGAATHSKGATIVRAVLALGKSLEIPVLAEGVETETDMALLTREGCDSAQGYLFGRPETIAAQTCARRVG